jgi:hypothetical protein
MRVCLILAITVTGMKTIKLSVVNVIMIVYMAIVIWSSCGVSCGLKRDGG